MTDSKTTQKIEIKHDLAPPSLYNVIFMNDNVTTMEFVVMVLNSVFSYGPEDAISLAEKIHIEQSAVVAVYPYELAEQKALETTLLARNNNFPLIVRIEESNT
jgi:ATP-dependent Clp protease adaptor protein ClpS